MFFLTFTMDTARPFFAAGQWDRLFGNVTSSTPLTLPTAGGVATLQSLAGQCPNAALHLQALGSLRGDTNVTPSDISLAVSSAVGTCNNSTRTGISLNTGLFIRTEPLSPLDNNHQIRIDHKPSEKQNMSFRWLYGFDNGFTEKTSSGSFTDTWMISTSWTNEFRQGCVKLLFREDRPRRLVSLLYFAPKYLANAPRRSAREGVWEAGMFKRRKIIQADGRSLAQ